MSIKKIQILTPIVTSVNGEFGDVTVDMKKLGIEAALDKKSDKNHTHDDRYYTESEINTKLNDKSNKSHTHDDRYYTESEINSKLNDIQVGGRNLWKNSKSEKSSADYNVTNIYYADNLISGEKYTVSL